MHSADPKSPGLLAPDIEQILDGRLTVGLPQLLKRYPVEWEKQRRQFS
jgi:hypothetical protein